MAGQAVVRMTIDIVRHLTKRTPYRECSANLSAVRSNRSMPTMHQRCHTSYFTHAEVALPRTYFEDQRIGTVDRFLHSRDDERIVGMYGFQRPASLGTTRSRRLSARPLRTTF